MGCGSTGWMASAFGRRSPSFPPPSITSAGVGTKRRFRIARVNGGLPPAPGCCASPRSQASNNWLAPPRRRFTMRGTGWYRTTCSACSRTPPAISGFPPPRTAAPAMASANAVQCITEDLSGRIYVTTGHGVDRLDPDGGGIRHYTTADGLSPGEFQAAYRDRHGTLWFATHLGLSQLVPEPDRPRSAPPILITRVSVSGTAYPISSLGESQISGPVLSPGQNFIQFDFVGLGFGAGEKLRYQYRLESAADDW